MKAKPWEKLDDSIKKNLMQEFAEKNDVDWGEYRDLTRRARQQGQANNQLTQQVGNSGVFGTRRRLAGTRVNLF